MLKPCDMCKKVFNARPYLIKQGRQRFCSSQCSKAADIQNIPGRFWRAVNKLSDPNGCWIWIAGKAKSRCGRPGYGSFFVNSKSIPAHRYSWILHFGEIPKGLFVCHKCDNPPCVNPNHLFLGTHKSNMQDMTEKHRAAAGNNNGSILHPERLVRGENHPNVKLTKKLVEEIRSKYIPKIMGSTKLSRIYSVNPSTILKIVNNKTWS